MRMPGTNVHNLGPSIKQNSKFQKNKKIRKVKTVTFRVKGVVVYHTQRS